MKIKIIISALVLLITLGVSTNASAQRHRWNSDDNRVYVPKRDASPVVYDGDRVLVNRHYHNYRRTWKRHYYDREYDRYNAKRHDHCDKYCRQHHYKYYYTRDYSRD